MRHEEVLIVPQTPIQMFDLVLDVESYPEFLPWCHSAHILTPKIDNQFDAELTVGKSNFSGSYISTVMFDRDKLTILAVYNSGPLKHMKTNWHFFSHELGCKIDFSIELSMKSHLLQKMMSLFFNDITKKMTTAFIERANVLYQVDRSLESK